MLEQEVDRMEQLQNKLHSYTVFGLPKVPLQLSFHQDSWEEEEEETNLELEDSWQQLLDNPEVHTHTHTHTPLVSVSHLQRAWRHFSPKFFCVSTLGLKVAHSSRWLSWQSLA